MTLPRLDETFTQDPHAAYASLRAAGSAHHVVMPDGLPAWVVTRYEDARYVLAHPGVSKDPRRFATLFDELGPDTAGLQAQVGTLDTHLLNSDPPDHTRLRKLVTKAFTPGRIEALRPRIEQITDDLLDRLPIGEPFDLLEAFAFPLPITVICELLGVPFADQEDFRRWTAAVVNHTTNDEVAQAVAASSGYLQRLVESKRQRPGDDLLSALVEAHDDDTPPLDDRELIGMAFLLLVAGHETTVNLIGNGVLTLLQHPDQLARLRADRSLLPSAIEEFIRYDGPVHLATLRVTAEPIKVGDVEIPANQFLLVSLTSANRDTERFDDADRFDVGRPMGGQLGFGHGIHYCLGAPLARLEGEIAFGRLLDRFPTIELAEPVQLRWRPSTLMRGLVTLPVRVASASP